MKMSFHASDVAMRFAALGDGDLDDALTDVISELGAWSRRFGAVRCFVMRHDPHRSFSLASEWCAPDRTPLSETWGTDRQHAFDFMPYFATLVEGTREPVLVRADALPPEADRERRSLQQDGADAFVQVTIRTGHRVRGSLSWRLVDLDDVATDGLVEVAGDVAAALAIALARLDDLDDFGVGLIERLLGADDDELDNVLTDCMAEVGLSIGADRTRLFMLHLDDLTVSAIGGWVRPGIDPRPTLDTDPELRISTDRWSWIANELIAGRIVRCDDLDDLAGGDEAAERDRQTLRAGGTVGILAVPVWSGDTVIGSVVSNRVQVHEPWTDRSVRRFRRLAIALRPVLERFANIEEHRRHIAHEREQVTTTLQLVSQLSHELKTPLHAIAGYAELIDPHLTDDEDRMAIRRIRENATRLISEIDDILAVSLPEGTTVSKIHPIIHALSEQSIAARSDRNIDISFSAVAETATVPLGRARARQVVRSLISGSMLSVGPDSSLRFSTTGDDDLRLELRSTTPIPIESLAFPVANAVLSQIAEVEIDRLDPLHDHRRFRDRVEVRLRFDRR